MLFNRFFSSFIPKLEMELKVPQPTSAKSKQKKKKASKTCSKVRALPNEIWSDIDGYEGRYQISSLGRCKRMPYTIVNINGVTKNFGEKLLKPQWYPGGVNPAYTLQNLEGVQAKLSAVRLMANAFGIELNSDECFARLEPFELPTCKTMQIVNRGDYLTGRPHRRREALSIKDKTQILMLRREGLSRKTVAQQFEITPEHVSHITGKILSN
mgnify:CR=1 FL=1